MNVALINKENGICNNVAVFETIEIANEMFSEVYNLIEQVEGYGIGDTYKDGIWSKNPQTEEEKQVDYDELSVKYVHEKYSYDDENKIMREYLSDMSNTTYKTAFEDYNAYVEECKQRAHKEIYGV